MRKLLSIMVSASAVSLAGCASLVSGPDQSIGVRVTPVVSARCVLSNKAGSWDLLAPDHADVTAAHGPLTVSCTSMTGDMHGEETVQPRQDPITMAGAVATGGLAAGAIAVGGPAGVGAVAIAGGAGGAMVLSAGEDQLTGAAWKYPLDIEVRLSPVTETVGTAAVSPGTPSVRTVETVSSVSVTRHVWHARRRRAAPAVCPPSAAPKTAVPGIAAAPAAARAPVPPAAG